MIRLNVNGQDHDIDADPDTPLLYVLRDELGLNGAKFGCGLGQCGACTVMVDGQAVFSCLTPVAVLAGRPIRTIEGLGNNAVQRAFIAGTGGAVRLLHRRHGDARPGAAGAQSASVGAEIRRHMAVNLCRCGTHMRILAAVRRAAAAMGSAER